MSAKESKTQLALFESELAQLAEATVKAEQSLLQSVFLSTKGGQLSYRGEQIANNKFNCVILSAPIERLYYSSRYDPTKIVPPDCFAISALASDISPSASAPAKQHDTCNGCPKNEWSSAGNGGKGKACRETRRLLLMHEDSLNNVEGVKGGEVVALRPPVTSLKNYATYIQTLAATLRRPPLAVITEVSVVPDAKTQFKINFRMIKPIDDEAVIKAIIDRSKDELQKAIDTAGAVNEIPTEEAVTADNARF